MTPSRPAVFLSYASEDFDSARKIREALQSDGIVVWFDQTTLRGEMRGIRQEIRGCATYPIVSGHTQLRFEGYFRLEWRLADQRWISSVRSLRGRLTAHARRNEAVGWYAIRDDGSEFHLFDDSLPSRSSVFA